MAKYRPDRERQSPRVAGDETVPVTWHRPACEAGVNFSSPAESFDRETESRVCLRKIPVGQVSP
jgi:hypothetical protein